MAIIEERNEEGKEISLIEEATIDEENNEESPERSWNIMHTIEEEKREPLVMEVKDVTVPDKSNGDEVEDEERRRILLSDK